MRTLWKVVLPLGLVLPMVAYVAGSLAASRSDDPVPRETIVIRDAPARTPTDLQTSAPGGDDRTGGRDDRDRRDDRDDREQDEVDDNGVRVVSPRPTPLGETDDATDDDQDDDQDDDRDDDRDDRTGRDDSMERDGDDSGGASRDD